jgi:hypothetical protein
MMVIIASCSGDMGIDQQIHPSAFTVLGQAAQVPSVCMPMRLLRESDEVWGEQSTTDDVFLILTLFKLFLKLTLGKHYLHWVDPLVVPGGVARHTAFAAPHAAARQSCRATSPGAVGVSQQAPPAPLSSSSSLSSSGQARPHPSVPPPPPASTPPTPAICGGYSVGNRSPNPWEGIALI